MSDYLWDKTGEPEEDVAELEQLLGTLRYEPRPLRLPEDLSARRARGNFRAQRSFQWQRLAVAASLLLTLLAGAWLLMKLNQHEVRRESAQQTTPAPVKNVADPNERATQQQATNNNVNDQPASQSSAPIVGERVNYRPAKRVSKRAGANARRRVPHTVAAQPREQVATMTPAQKEATEKLLLALRITSAKLNYAQREVQEMSAAHRPETR